MGQNMIVPRQDCSVSVRSGHAMPVNSLMVMQTQIPKYAKKNWQQRLITHWTVGEIGGVNCSPFGCASVKMDTITAVKPRYTDSIIKYRATQNPYPRNLFSTSYSMSPSHFCPPSSPSLTLPPSTSGTAMAKMHWNIRAYAHM